LMTDTYWTFRRLGILEKLKASPFVRKYSVQFANSAGKESRPFYFFEAVHHESAVTWQVTRAKFDELLIKTNYGAGLSGNDKQLVPAIADVQARILGMLYHLTNIGIKVIGVAPQLKISKAMVEESINSYKKFPTQ